MIALEGVNYRAGAQRILKDIHLHLERGEFVALVGPSGAGKTSLLRLIAGLIEPDDGRVVIDGRVAADTATGVALAPQHRHIGFVFQDLALWPHMRVDAHLDWPLKLAHAGQRAERIEQLLDIVQLGHKQYHYPHTLSGGEQQRLALARALAGGPKILLLDEPFASLDRQLRTDLRQILRQLHRECGTTSLLVTHDQEEAMALADRVAIMRAGELMQVDRADRILSHPATAFVAGFFGSPPGCLLPAIHRRESYRCLGQPLRLDLPPGFGADLSVYYRPENLRLEAGAGSAGCPVTITEALPVGRHWHYRLRGAERALDVVSDTWMDPRRDDIRLLLPARPDAIFRDDRILPRKKLVLVRHAISEWNREGRLQGRADRPLAAPAAAQMQALRQRLRGQAFARIETSPLARARDSAELLTRGDNEIDIVPGWCEIDVGSWEGQMIGDLDPAQYRAWRAGRYTPAGGETWAQFCGRIKLELERLAALEGDSLVICHGGVIRACLQLLLAMPLEDLPPSDYASARTLWLEPIVAAEA